MRTIQWHFETGMVGGDRSGEIEVDDDATDEQIDLEVNMMRASIGRKPE